MPQPEDPPEEIAAALAEGPGATTTQEEPAGKRTGKKAKAKKGKNNKQQDDNEDEERKQQDADLLAQLEAEQTPAETPANEISQPSYPEPPTFGNNAFGQPSNSQATAAAGGGAWGFDEYDQDPYDEPLYEAPKSPGRSPHRAPQDMTADWAQEPYVPLDSQAPVRASPKPSPSRSAAQLPPSQFDFSQPAKLSPSRAAAQLPPSQFDFSQPTHSAPTFGNNWFEPPAQSSSQSMHTLPHAAAPARRSPRRSPIQIPQELHSRATPPASRPPPVPIEGLATKAEAVVHQYAPDPAKYQERIVQVRAPERSKPEDSEFLRRVGGNVKPDVVFLRRHFHGEGKLSESQAVWILEKAAEIFQAEPNVLDLEAPITSESQEPAHTFCQTD